MNKRLIIIASSVACGVLILGTVFGIFLNSKNKKKEVQQVKNTVSQVLSEESSQEKLLISEPEDSSVASEPQKADIAAVIKSEKAKVKPSTGSVITAPEYKYNPKDDIKQNTNDKNKEEPKPVNPPKETFLSNSITIVALNPTETPLEDNSSSASSDSSETSSDNTQSNDDSSAESTTSENNSESSPDSSDQSDSSGTESGETTDSSGSEVTTGSSEESSSSPVVSYSEGWNNIGGKLYYYHDGKQLKGWYDLDGFRYYFDDKTGEKKSSVCIDVSRYQGNIDWQKVRAAGVEYAIIRVGYRGYETGKLCIDDCFERNIKGAINAGIKCGVYIYSTAINEYEAVEEANFVLNAVKGYRLDLPIFIDQERLSDRVAGLSNAQRTNNIIYFIEAVKAANQKVWYYTYYNYYKNYIDAARLSQYNFWLAYYTDNIDRVSDVTFKCWQYTSSGKVDGISGRVDMSIYFP